MAERRVVVVGATGAQGGGVARALLADEDGGFAVRAVTRKPGSEAARRLAEAGAEIVRADLDDPASVERAFEGAWGAFCVTNYFEHFSGRRETAQGKAMARAAATAGVRHAVWSTFEEARAYIPLDDDRMPTLQERYKVPHIDAKAEVNGFFEEAGVPTTLLYTSAYFENLIFLGWGPQKTPDGDLAVTFPMGNATMPFIAVEDIGRCAAGIFRRTDEYVGRRVGVASEHLTGAELAAQLGEALRRPIRYNDIPADLFRSFDFPGAQDVGNMFQFMRDFSDEFVRHRSTEESRRLNPEMQSFRTWLEANAGRIPVPV